MARFTVASVLLALASVVSAQTDGYHAITKPGLSEVVEAGKPYTITWTYAPAYTGNVVLRLIGGETQGGQVDLYTVGSALGSDSQLVWNVDCAETGKAFYGLKIIDASNEKLFQYSTPFKIVSSDACASTSGTSSTTGSSSATGTSATVTATLSSVSHTTTVHTNTTVTTDCTTSSAHIPTSVINYNSTIITSKTKGPEVVTSTAFSTAALPTTTKANATATAVGTSGATRAGGSIFMLAGVAAAFFVL